MPQLLRGVVDVLLYGHLWIALGAVALYTQSNYLLSGTLKPDAFSAFLFCGTLGLYALHRLFALRIVDNLLQLGRYRRVYKLRWLNWLMVVGAGAGCLLIWGQLSLPVRRTLIIPCLLSALYVLPVFGGARLRDLSYLKVFVLALVWAWLTVIVPAVEVPLSVSLKVGLLAGERFFFIFANGLTFDIRDVGIDRRAAVRTLPGKIGMVGSKWLAYAALVLMASCSAVAYYLHIYPLSVLLAVIFSGLGMALLVYGARPERSDYYFTGWVDGIMILQFCLFYILEMLA